jgi:hypothetical protein
MNNITSNIPATIRTMQETAPCGGPATRAFLPFAGLNFAIHCDVSTAHVRINFMTRRALLPLAALLNSCGKKQPPPDLFPETVASVWRRAASPAGPAGAADPVPAGSVRQMLTANYSGAGRLQARAYELTSPAVALDVVQRWRPSADTVFFHRENWLVVVKWEDAPRADVQAFVRETEKRLDAGTK